ncbi:MAG: rhodanese-like domain-containing protein [Dermatophilus congolensis]|nr:rhodanese-like domain-containing protein [Dermatophilus congolensis]
MTSPDTNEIPAVENAALPDNAQMLDVREVDEWNLGHAPNSVLIPLGELPSRLADLPEPRPLHVVCRSGGRSSRAVAFLRENGIDAINVTGGMLGWQAAGRPMTTGDGSGSPLVQ